jgi:hypothetical protein
MADVTRSTWDPFLFEMQGKVNNLFPTEAVFLAELHGVDVSQGGEVQGVSRITSDDIKNRDIFSGRRIRHTVVTAYLPAGGFVPETGTWNVPQVLASKEVWISLVRALQPFSVSVDVERDSFDNANASAVEGLMDQARVALARTENIALLGDGTGNIATCQSSGAALTTNLSAGSNFDIILPGTVWDIVTTSTGVKVTGGARRLVASVSESTPSVTFDTAQQASDGDSGNITFAAGTTNLAIPGSASTAATAGTVTAQGLEQAAATTGTFENIDKAATTQWQGTDGRGGDTTTLPLSAQMLDGGVRRGRRAGIGTWDFGIGDPAAIDLYKQGLYAQVRFDPQSAMLKSGFSGIIYDGADKPFPMIKEPVHKKGGVKLIDKASFVMYGDKVGPQFLDDDGSIFRRFGRSLPKEADLLDRFQMGVVKCNTIVFFNNLASAS